MNQEFYTPEQAAKKLCISRRMLQYMRQTGRIEGTFVGNMYLYTEEQIKNANMGKEKPGPKTSKKTSATQDSGDEPRDSSANASAA